jgi:hypothetical protein
MRSAASPVTSPVRMPSPAPNTMAMRNHGAAASSNASTSPGLGGTTSPAACSGTLTPDAGLRATQLILDSSTEQRHQMLTHHPDRRRRQVEPDDEPLHVAPPD